MAGRATLPYPAKSQVFRQTKLLHGQPVGRLISQTAHASVFCLGADQVLLVYHVGCEPDQGLRVALKNPPTGLCPILDSGTIDRHAYDVLPRLKEALPWKSLSSKDKLHVAVEELKALQKLHQLGYCHLDVKLQHFMVDDSGSTMLIDFSTARPATGTRTGFSLHFTPYYAAPEIKGGGYSTASDMYSYGVMLAERRLGLQSPGYVENLFAELSRQLMQATPEARLTADEALNVLMKPRPRIALLPAAGTKAQPNKITAHKMPNRTSQNAVMNELVAIAERANPLLAARNFKQIPCDWHMPQKAEAVYTLLSRVNKAATRVNVTNITRQNVRAVMGCSVITEIPGNIRNYRADSPAQILPRGSYYILSRDGYARWQEGQKQLEELRRERNIKIAKAGALAAGFVAILPFAIVLAVIGIMITLIFAVFESGL